MSEGVSDRFYLVPFISAGCLKTEFDSTYPIHLNGIIRQDEFQQSIANINRAVSSRTSLVNALLMLIGLCIVGGFILFVVGGATAVNSGSTGFPPLVGVGFGLVGCGMLVCICGCAILQTDRNRRVQEAIAAESLKYSNRSPTPCSWRLDAKTTTWTDQNNDRRASTSYAVSAFFSQLDSTASQTIFLLHCR